MSAKSTITMSMEDYNGLLLLLRRSMTLLDDTVNNLSIPKDETDPEAFLESKRRLEQTVQRLRITADRFPSYSLMARL
jgi:hypothetical protein